MSPDSGPLRERIASLSEDKARLLELLLREKAQQPRGIKPRARKEGTDRTHVPTSRAQQRLWFIHQLEGGSPAYYIAVSVRLRGPLSPDALQEALDGLLERHEVLRTRFVTVDGIPHQEILPNARFALSVVQAGGVQLQRASDNQLENEIRRHELEEAHAGFDLSTGPLIRGRLLQLDANDHVLLLTAHHIIADGWSVTVLLRDLSALYEARLSQTALALEPLPVQYADYSQWQHEWLQSAAYDKQLRYWTSHLKGAPALLELPTDRPRPAVQSYRGGNLRFSLSAKLCSALRHLAQSNSLTLFMVLYAAWSILLARLSSQDDLVIGVPIANRQHAELEQLIGFFVNTLALRVSPQSDMQVREFLAQVRSVTLAAYDHQDTPFERIVAALHPERSLSRNPIFQVMFALQSTPKGDARFAGLTATLRDPIEDPAIFDLFASLEERDEEIIGTLNYAADLFNPDTLERWIASYTVLLEDLTGDLERPLGNLRVLFAQESHRLVHQLNATAAELPSHRGVHELVEEQAHQTPNAIAVTYEGNELTYAQLNARANKLARHLAQAGVQPGQLVGICIARSIDMVVALLGILKAGAAYVPLDPNYPPDRLRYMLDDSTPSVVLTQEAFRARLEGAERFHPQREGTRPQLITLDTVLQPLDGTPDDNLTSLRDSLDGQSLAYVIYTSGSTGLPKGTAMPHRALINLIHWHRSGLGSAAAQRVLQFAALSFDVAFQEIFSTLATGGTLVLLDEWIRRDTRKLAALLTAERINRLFVPPLVLQSLAEFLTGDPTLPSTLRDVITAGEPLHITPAIVSLFTRLPGCRLHNHYGPTETHVASALTLDSDPRGWPAWPSIGRPIANTQIYVLDPSGQPAPTGAKGEIYIGGLGLAQGYLHRPDLTNARFLADRGSVAANLVHPNSPIAELLHSIGRLYKTGDLGRWRPDGTLEYLGRNDDQVKIRGYRVEPGEIETQLRQHAAVAAAAVVAREDRTRGKHLVAYVVLRSPERDDVGALRSHLEHTLPEHMIPSAFVILPSLPLTPNGKLDRRSLPPPDFTAHGSRTQEPPIDAREQHLAGIWQALLRLDRVSRHDNFFELGGHSLLLVQLLERLRSRGLTATVRDLYGNPTLAAMAAVLSEEASSVNAPTTRGPTAGTEVLTPERVPLIELTSQEMQSITAFVPGGAANVEDVYPLAPLQEGILFHSLLDTTGSDIYSRPMLFSVSSWERVQALIQALQRVIDRHDILRTAFLWEGLPRPVQVVYRNAVLPVREIALDPEQSSLEQLRQRLRPERQRMDLRWAPLIHLEWAFDRQNGRWYALIQTHHLVCDNQSLDLLLAELMGHLNGSPHQLPPPVPYRHHIAQLLARSHAVNAESFFRSKLGDLEEPTAPFDILDVHGNALPVEEARAELPRELASRLRTQARRLGTSTATLFHAAWALVLGSTTGRDDVVFGTVLLGRLHGNAGTQNILGLLINTLPLRLRLDTTVHVLIEQTQRELTELLEHEHASLAVAQRCSGITGSKPLFSTLLNFRRGTANSNAQWSAAEGIELLESPGTTNYPVVFSVDDDGDHFALVLEADPRIGAQRMLGYIWTSLHSLSEALESALQTHAPSLPVLPASELDLVIRRFNPAPALLPHPRLIHELFEEQVGHTPEAIAVTHLGKTLTYAQLNAAANRVAHELRNLGVTENHRVGLCVERGIELLTGLIGILKAGGAYIPLDPSYPPERLAYMLQDAKPVAVITQSQLVNSLPNTDAYVLVLDRDGSITPVPAITPPPPSSDNRLEGGRDARPCTDTSSADRLAYVIYTSGSTGRPKGVMVTHANVVRLFSATQSMFNFSSSDVWTLFHSFAFDFSVWEIWGALLHGGRLVIVPQLTTRSPDDLYHLLCTEGVTVLNQTPSAFRQLIDAQARNTTTRHKLRTVIFGGEALDVRSLRPWVERNGLDAPQLINGYGITETTVFVTFRLLSREDIVVELDAEAAQVGSVIGKPIADLRVYVLNAHGEPVPVGVPGEIHIAGDGVARGYLNQPQLTAAAFIRDPFSGDPSSRLYRSGDRARWRADGALEFLGRMDGQVKIRGFRIEPAEIEAQLARHPSIKDVVVIARADTTGDWSRDSGDVPSGDWSRGGGDVPSGGKRLVAYVIPHPQSAPTAEDLRAHLSSTLPEHMVPAAYVLLQQFPLTSNGKLDRRALPAPDPGAFVSRGHQPPVSQAERDLAEIWRVLLARDYVGREDNFFELGGHSLLIVQMLEQLRRKGWSATVRSLFESPTLATLASLLRKDTDTQPDIPPNLIPSGCRKITPEMLPLVALSPQHLERIVSSVPGGAENIQDIYPLTPLQEGLLFHHLVTGEGADTYVVPTLLAVSSRKRLDQLIAALQAVIDRHDILRTAVLWERLPQSVQVVYRHARLPVEEVTLSEHGDPAAQALEWLEPRQQRLDLTQAPLMRLRIAAHPGTDTWYALLQLHHLVGDNTSQDTMTAEVMAHLQGHPSQLPPALPYRDHVARALSKADGQAAEEFFRRKLADVTEATAPFGLLDVHGDGSQIEEAHEELDPMLARGIRHHARRMEISPATLFHAAWALVVARTSAREDVVFGTVLLGRLHGIAGGLQPNAGQPLLGMFINTLPLRLRLSGVGVRQLVELTQRELVELLTHEQASLATAQRCSGIGGFTPLFSALLNYRHGGRRDSAGWMAAEGIHVLAGRDRTNYPMTASVEDSGEGFVLTAQTDRRIDPKRITAYLRTALEALVRALEESPQTPALDLPVLPESERRQLLDVFNDTRCSYPRDALIHELFEEQVTRTPDCIAAVCGEQSLRYSQLNQRANQLARHLMAQGVGPEELVGVCLERGLEMIIALFAILKAGGAYVPLDPSHPRERLAQMLADARPKVVVTQQSLQDRLPTPIPGSLPTPAIVSLDTHTPVIGKLVPNNPNPRERGLRSSHLAYVIYTSGSTGAPKGVAIEHRNTVNLICWARSVWDPAVLQSTLLSTSLNFDLSVYECFVPLTTGGRLEIVANALSLAQSPADVTLINTVPSAIRALMDAGRIPSTTRVVNLAGEPLEENVVSRVFAQSHVERVYNLYGPTETTTYSSAIELSRETGFVRSIGRPIANTQIYVLNEQRQLVPPDVTGEIYIGGDGVARGYLRHPELTAERFIPNPFVAQPDAKFYKTGDLGRWNSDGTLEYVGRSDAQVKVRGFRIELGDIETSLARHPLVKEVAVTARDSDVDTGKRLVAYVILSDPSVQDENVAESLRAHLQRALPDYMIPSAFVFLDRFPLTPNGKVDRRALPAPARSEAVDSALLSPTGETEEQLARIWSRLLGVERIGRHDNFFELGGHSLDVIRLTSEVAANFAVKLTVPDVFQHGTLAQLAAHIDNSQSGDTTPPGGPQEDFESGVI